MPETQDETASATSYPDQAQVAGVEKADLLEWIDTSFLRHDPFLFRDHNFPEIARLASRLLDVDPNGIYCLGSGAIGLSMNPEKVSTEGKLKPFDDTSDLDLAVISSHYFDLAWRDLRLSSQPILSPLNKEHRDLIRWQKKRLFDGAIVADRVMPLLSFSDQWVRSLGQISEKIAIMLGRNIEVHVWIYRDYWSVRNYVAEGISECQKKMV